MFVAAHIAIAWSLVNFGSLNIVATNSTWERLIQQNGMIGALFPVISLVLEGFIRNRWKEILVFWRIKNSLPGHRVFSELAPDDSRIDLVRLEARHGTLPTTPKDQNRLWYRIYKKHTDKPLILEVHKKYLMARDIAAISFFLVFVGVGLVAWFRIWNKAGAWYLGFVACEYIILAVTAQNYGKRFVCNVLADESSEI